MGSNSENNTKPSCGLSVYFCLTYVSYFTLFLYEAIYLFTIPQHYVLCGLALLCTVIAATKASKCALVFCYIFVILAGIIESLMFSQAMITENAPDHFVNAVSVFSSLRLITTILFLIATTMFVNSLRRLKKEQLEKEKRENDIEAVKLSIQKDEQAAKQVPVVVYTNQNIPAEHYVQGHNKNTVLAYNVAPVNPQYATPMNNLAFNPNMNAPVGQYMNNSNNAYVGPAPNNFMPTQYNGPNGV